VVVRVACLTIRSAVTHKFILRWSKSVPNVNESLLDPVCDDHAFFLFYILVECVCFDSM
jgi:hypothetical protein